MREDLPPVEHPWPGSASVQPSPLPAPPAVPSVEATTPPPVEERAAQEPPRAAEPHVRRFEELAVSAQSVLGLQTETRLSSDTSRVEDRVDARVTRDVRVGGRMAIPAGSRALGSVTEVERGGKFRQRARIGIRFHTLVLADSTQLSISTETIIREGDAPGNAAAAKVGGGAVGGAILGAIIGGAKGAAIGATAGAGGGAAVVEAGEPSTLVLPAGSTFSIRLLSPVSVTVEED